MAKWRHAGLGFLFLALMDAPARAQTAPNTPPPVGSPGSSPALPPPAAPPPAATVPIEPITSAPVTGSTEGAMNGPTLVAPAPLLAPTPAAPRDAPPLTPPAAPDSGPFYTRWWFWTAVGAAAVTTGAILIATSGSSPPHTDFGNMPAF
jgi:hypothetical protein